MNMTTAERLRKSVAMLGALTPGYALASQAATELDSLQKQLDMSDNRREELASRLHQQRLDNEQVQEQLAEAKALLKRIQWQPFEGSERCALCHEFQCYHDSRCALAAMVKKDK